MHKILIIEDEEPIRELIRLNLDLAGYDVLDAADGLQGIRSIKEDKIDLVLLDIMLPGLDGYQVLPEVTKKHIPVILLTARDSLKDKVKGLEMGADDYLTKPFEAVELLARIKAVLRRSCKDSVQVNFDDVQVLLQERKVLKDGREVRLTLKEFELLKLLSENRGRVMSREQLLDLVWDYDYAGSTRTVDMHIQRLRKKLETDRIRTVFKVGYRLEA